MNGPKTVEKGIQHAIQSFYCVFCFPTLVLGNQLLLIQ